MNPQPMTQEQEVKTFLQEEEDLDVYCGTQSCRPKVLQCCANIKAFTFFISISSLLSFSLTMYLGSQVTAIEKHFNFNSGQSGILLGSNDIGFLVSVLIFSYALKNSHIPRVLGISSAMYGLAGIVCSIPYFFYPVPFITKNQTDTKSEIIESLCEVGSVRPNETVVCEKIGSKYQSHVGAFAVILFGMILQGLAKASRSPLQASYIDDNVKKTKTGAYMGLIVGISILGPAVAFMLGGIFSRIYVTLEDVDLTPQDSHWIGAWWLGFIFFGLLSITASIPLFFFPKRMKSKEKSVVIMEKESLQKILKTSKRLMTNPLFICMCCFSFVRSFAISGSVTFMPKYFETQFQIPSWKSNLIIGCSYILMASLGSIGGGILSGFFKIGPRGSIKFLLIINFFAFFLLWVCPAITCPQPEFVKTHQSQRFNFSSIQPVFNFTNEPVTSCRRCECNEFEYDPVCGENGQNFQTPCMAGCQRKSSTGFGYENCTCVGGNQTAIPGTCPMECNGPLIVAAVLAIRSFLECFCVGPNMLITLRCVSDADKTFALGIMSFLSSLLGWLPGPPTHGALIDTFCAKWRHLPCGGSGACVSYDVDKFRIGFFSLQGGLHFLSDVFIVIVGYYGLRTKRYFQKHELVKIHNGKEHLGI